MSVYTTEVRYICEYEAGLTESVGFNDVDSVIEESWDKIFADFPIFDEAYRKPLCKKILQHYYTREICSETVGLWKFWLNQKMREIMPYYNQLYSSESLKFDPLNEINLTRIINEETTGNATRTDTGSTRNNDASKSDSTTTNGGYEENSGSSDTTSEQKRDRNTHDTLTANDTSTSTETSDGKNLHSDTPQGSIQNITENGYLTDATITNDSKNVTANQTNKTDKATVDNETENGTVTTVNGNTHTINTNSTTKTNNLTSGSVDSQNTNKENKAENRVLSETLNGKNSSASFSKLLSEYRETFLNIDIMVIMELTDLFMNIY